MSFTWSRSAGTIQSRCTRCPLVLTARNERDLLVRQRGHDPLTCANTRRNPPGMSSSSDRLGEGETAPESTPRPPLDTPIERSILT